MHILHFSIFLSENVHSDDKDYIKNIEVKKATSEKSSQMAKNIKEGFEQVGEGGAVAVYLPLKMYMRSRAK